MSNTTKSPSPFPSPYVISPANPHTHTIIFLHGRGDNGPNFAFHTFGGLNPEGTLASRLPNWKWIFPAARRTYSTVFREQCNEWFDIWSLTDPSLKEDLQVDGLRQSVTFVLKLVEEESRLVGAGNVVLGGISQGCATSVHALLAGSRQLGGWIGVSGWIPFRGRLEQIANGAQPENSQKGLTAFYREDVGIEGVEAAGASSALNTPALLCHGIDDGTIDISLGLQVKATVESLGMNPAWREYDDCGHWFKEPEGMDDIMAFLENVAKIE